MIPIARLGDMHACPIKGHGTTPIVSASPDTQINFLGAARVGDLCGCGAAITVGFPSIVVDNRPLAYLGSPTSHGGKVIAGSADTFGGFNVGGGTAQVIVDFAKLGAIRPDGSVDEPLMANLLADPGLEKRASDSGALVQAGDVPTQEGAQTPELIAVAGSQHDVRSANKMMFIGQAVRELSDFKRSNPDKLITLIVFTQAYNQTMLSAARNSAADLGASFVTVSSVQMLIEYLNQGLDRRQSPIEHLSVFSHGVPQQIAFGYELPEQATLSLNVLNFHQISPSAFAPTATVESYACRTGMGNRPDYRIEEAVQLYPQTNESLAQLMANHLQLTVRAYIRRSDYKNTWGSFAERRMGNLCGISDNAAPAEDWCNRWERLAKERRESHELNNFTYHSTGAINPVISGDTPVGVPGGVFDFSPK